MSINLSSRQTQILCLLALRFAGGLLPETSLSDILTSNDCNALSVSEAIGSLVEDKHITRVDGESELFVKIETSGKVIAEQLKNDVPITVREKIAASAAEEIARQRSKASVDSSVSEIGDGFQVNVSLRDDGITLMNLILYSPTRFQADMIVRSFSASPANVYKKIVSFLTETDRKEI